MRVLQAGAFRREASGNEDVLCARSVRQAVYLHHAIEQQQYRFWPACSPSADAVVGCGDFDAAFVV